MATHIAHYQLNREPFGKDINTEDAYLSTDFKECATRLDYLNKAHGLALVCAAPGFGKSFCLRAFAERQNPNLVRMVYICMTTLTAREFYRQLCVSLGIEPAYRKIDMFTQIQEHLEYAHTTKHQHVIIVIDEAQYLPTSILRDIKLLMNFEYDSKDKVSFVLCGQPVLADVLSRQIHEALRQRIVVNYTFSGLAESEAKEYVMLMMQQAGGNLGVFEQAAIHAAYNDSNGCIRTFGRILTKALMAGAGVGADVIDVEMIMAASNELEIR